MRTPQPAKRDVAPASTAGGVASRRNDERSIERSKRDLFGQELQLSARVVEHNESPFTAARNENSVLFSLDQLSKPRVPETFSGSSASSVAPSAPTAEGGVRTKADSGLIDLNALMSKPLDAKSVRPAPLSEPPLGAFTLEVERTPSSNDVAMPAFRGSKKKGKLIAAASAAAVFLFVGVGLMASSREDARVEAAAKAAAQPPPVAAPVVETPPAPAPVAVAEAPAETKAEPTTRKASGKAGARKAGASKAKSSSAALPAAPAAPKKAADPCGCRGDLLCSMKCSAK